MILTRRHYLLAGGAVLLAVALGIAAASLPNRAEPMVIPESTAIHVTLEQALASNQSRPGDHFEATVSEPVIVDGKTVIPQGASAEGLVVDARPSGRLNLTSRAKLLMSSLCCRIPIFQYSFTMCPVIGERRARIYALSRLPLMMMPR